MLAGHQVSIEHDQVCTQQCLELYSETGKKGGMPCRECWKFWEVCRIFLSFRVFLFCCFFVFWVVFFFFLIVVEEQAFEYRLIEEWFGFDWTESITKIKYYLLVLFAIIFAIWEASLSEAVDESENWFF